MLVLILSCVCGYLFCLFIYRMLFSVDTDKINAVLVDYSLAIHFVHAVKKLE